MYWLKGANIVIEIIGHTNNTNNPGLELALSKKELKQSKIILFKKGLIQTG